MADLPRATQSLTPKDVVQRYAVCPDHNKRSSEYMGPGQLDGGRVTWKFRCTAKRTNKDRADHIFPALPDRTAPKTSEESVEWMNKQRLARVERPTKSQS